MRFLNKVIFIESANIRYAEVKLDETSILLERKV